ncbi:MAG: hypothetical protein BWY89_01485 [Bacteroidetes bacterium ADurb.BinA012]|nr:MAG: hypothetical protein BWY89_01485 [Bacteroidetes bacterium ADurb.BinA012]
MAKVTPDQTNRLQMISHFLLSLSPMIPATGLISPYIQRKTAISLPKFSAFSNSTMSTIIAFFMVESIWRSI